MRRLVAGATLLAGAFLFTGWNCDAASVPDKAPRTGVLSGKHAAFKEYCASGDGARAFAKIKADLDQDFMAMPFPPEPLTYGDPDPTNRDSAKADKWRGAQDVCGRVSGVAEAATIAWLVTGEQKYLLKAKDFLLKSCEWSFGPDWTKGALKGATDIEYNDEAHFRLWRKMPLVYDQLREALSAEERKAVLAHFKERGQRSVQWINPQKMGKIRRNSVKEDAPSHAVRFMAMTGLAGLALWDDLPESREWWRFSYNFYKDQFSPWGGDDGGWAEGCAYWRGTFEHAAFQDALLAIGDPLAYNSPFWKNSPLFAVYNVQPYLHTIFGDTSNAGRFNLDPNIADYMEHMARVHQNGYLLAYAQLCSDKRPRPAEKGLSGLDRTYPTACEFLVRDFIVSTKPLPQPKPLSELPGHRFFRDVGWVSMHSSLGQPEEDIHITFKSSPYGSYSHSHADQNGFILNAFGEGLAINSAYREFHRSPHHQQWTWQTKSKNALLINGLGQPPQERGATGKITRLETLKRGVWTTGDATEAYRKGQRSPGDVRLVTRDLLFLDNRYLVLRDKVHLNAPGKISWLLHAENDMAWDAQTSQITIRGASRKAALTARVLSPSTTWTGSITDKFPVPVDSRYLSGQAGSSYITGEWTDQRHLTLDGADAKAEHLVFAVLWPSRKNPEPIHARLVDNATVEVARPDGKKDYVRITDSICEIADAPPKSAPPPDKSAATVSSTASDVEKAPETLPKATSFIFRDTKPEPLRIHVFKPKDWKASDKRSALVFFFGGGWSKGTPEKSATWGKLAADNGMVGVCPDYRTKNRFNTSPMESVADGRAAVRWVQERAAELGVDPSRIVVGGTSAGGHLALWTAISKCPPGSAPELSPKSKPAAVILLSAVSDASPLTGYTPTRFGTNAIPLSPIHNLEQKMPPILAFHGDSDNTVPYAQATALRDKISLSGGTCELVTVPGGDHNFSSQLPEWKEKSRAQIIEFLKKQGLL